MGTISALSVKDYGAAGDGSTDDSSAIRTCIQAALAGWGPYEGLPSKRPTIYFPEGVYAIHDDAVLSDWGNSDIRVLGMKFVGAGMGASSLKLITAEGARWFWDNRGDTYPRKLSLGVFQDLMFESDQDMSDEEVVPLANGFRMWSNGHEKQWRFVNCFFQNLTEAFRTDGSGNADQVKFFGCNFWRIKDAVLSTFNNQSVAMNFYGCDYHTYGDLIRVDGRGGPVTSITSTSPAPYVVTSTDHGLTTGDYVQFYNVTGLPQSRYFVTVIDDDTFSLNGSTGGTATTNQYSNFRAGGGGSISVNGGSVTMANDPQTPGREKYLLNSSRPNNGAEDYCFSNLKVELYGSGTGCCVMGDWNNYLRSATFRDCNFRQIDYTTNGDPRPGVVLGAHRTVTFDNCIIPPQWNYSWDTSLIPGGSENTVSMPSLIVMQNCMLVDLQDGFYDRISGGGGSHGRFIVRNCRAHDASVTPPLASEKHAVDHDYLWMAGGLNDVSVQKKYGVLARFTDPFPRNGGNEWTLKLPASACILGVHALKQASGSSSQSYVLKIGNDDKSVVYASSDNPAHLKRELDGSAGTVTTTISQAHEVHVDNIWRFCFADVKDQTVRMWAEHTGVTENHTLGYALVEYI